jgi:large subunit ribosomal protein L29
MKPNEIRDMADADLEQKLKDARVELFNLRFQLATGQLDNPGRIQNVKRDIARLHTEVRAR